MKIILIMYMIMSFNFMFMKHPLSMGFILLFQTILSCIVCSYNMYSYMMSYILFLIFIGGMLILFMYMSSIASNEKFIFSMKLMMTNFIFLIIGMIIINSINYNNEILSLMVNIFDNQNKFLMNKLFMLPSGMMTLLMMIYLLFTLIVIVNIMSSNLSPLRST